jgi:hypothetical protein
MEEIEFVGAAAFEIVQIKNLIGEKAIAFFVWKTKLDSTNFIIP